MNKKGFTLIELIVAIAIMGVITAMSISGVRNLQARNRLKKFEEYGKSLEEATKLYVDSNGKNLFSGATDCIEVNYSNLVNADLIKDFPQKDITCENGTYVVVRKEQNINSHSNYYTYKVQLHCTYKGAEIYPPTGTVDVKCH